jgi:hypothetical protein
MAFQPPFSAEQLPGAAFGMSDVDFANYFARFALAEFAKKLFTERFYARLMQEFGHIAHYNRYGFYDHWFRTTADRVRFLQFTLKVLCFWQPLEQTIGQWIRKQPLLEHWSARLAAEIERRQLALLKARCESAEPPPPTPFPPPIPTAQKRVGKGPHTAADVADQLLLF